MRFLFSRCCILLTVILFINSSSIFAQNAKPPVAIYDFTYNPDLVAKEYLPSIKQFVTSAFQNTKRFTILNRSSSDALLKEKDLTSGPEYFLNKVKTDFKKVGAKYIVTGNMDRMSVEKITSSQNLVSYRAAFSFFINIIDPATNTLVASKQIEVSDGDGFFGGITSTSPAAAIDNALKKISDKIENFIKIDFPYEPVKVVEILSETSSKVEKVLVAAGSGYGLANGDKVEIFTPTEVELDGKKTTREKFLGEAKIEKVEDASFSICKITKGGEEMKQASTKGQVLMCKIVIKNNKFNFLK